MEKPTAHKPAKVPISDTGTATIGISVARQFCRNRYTTSTTSKAASKMVLVTSLMDESTNKVVSKGIAKSMSCGNAVFNSRMRRRTDSATSSAFAPGCR